MTAQPQQKILLPLNNLANVQSVGVLQVKIAWLSKLENVPLV